MPTTPVPHAKRFGYHPILHFGQSIVKTSMDDIRFKLRQAIYSVALKKSAKAIALVQQDYTSTPSFEEYEDWLLDNFIVELIQTKETRPPTVHDYAEKYLTFTARPKNIVSSAITNNINLKPHKMTISIETYTVKPLNSSHKTLITSDNLLLMDVPKNGIYGNVGYFDLITNMHPHLIQNCLFQLSSSQFHLPLWVLALATGSILLFFFLLIATILLIIRRKRKHSQLERKRNSLTISGGKLSINQIKASLLFLIATTLQLLLLMGSMNFIT
uniref:RGS domain-containing protein n=1 Tax=Heterorhabditis bacteriophora TaxID=37862 RepID=A0A1I7XQJ3_HETBA